jgi:hypothetical protein
MPKFNVTAPDGQKFTVDGPEGSSIEDAYRYVEDNLWHPKEEAKPEEEPSTLKTLAHGAERAALPTLGGFAGMGAGAALGALGGPAAPITVPLGAIAGGLGAGALTSAVQEKILQSYPELAKKLGLDEEQRLKEEKAHPYASFIGEAAPSLLGLRPSGALLRGGKEAYAAGVNALANLGLGAGIEAGQQAMGEEPMDWTKVGIAGAAGALGQKETALGRKVIGFGERIVPEAIRNKAIEIRNPEEFQRIKDRLNAEYEQKLADAKETSSAQILQLPFDPRVADAGQTPIYVHPDGSTSFVTELTEAGLKEKYPENIVTKDGTRYLAKEKAKPYTLDTLPPVIGTEPNELAAFGKTFGIGRTATILRPDGPLAGRDISNPADAAHVKTVLEAYANGKPAKGAADKIETFLKRPEFKEVTSDVIRPTEAIAGTTQPSIRVPSVRRKPAKESTASEAGRLGSDIESVGQPDVGAGAKPTPLGDTAGLIEWVQSKGLSPAELSADDWKILENTWREEHGKLVEQAKPKAEEVVKEEAVATKAEPTAEEAPVVAAPREKVKAPKATPETKIENKYLQRIDEDIKARRYEEPENLNQAMLDYVAGDLAGGNETAQQLKDAKKYYESLSDIEKQYVNSKIAERGRWEARDEAFRIKPEEVSGETIKQVEKKGEPDVYFRDKDLRGREIPKDVVERNTKLENLIDSGADSRALLDHIVADETAPHAVRKMARKLSKFLPDVKVEFKDVYDDVLKATGSYNPITDSIFIDRANNPDHALTLMHEYVHALTYSPMFNGSKAGKEVKKIYEQYKKYNKDADHYGLTNSHEFIAEALSNPEFQDFLKTAKHNGVIGGFWNKIVQAFREFFNFPPKDVVDELLSLAHGMAKNRPADVAEMRDFFGKKLGENITEFPTPVYKRETQADNIRNLTKESGYTETQEVKRGPFQTIKETHPEDVKKGLSRFLTEKETMWFSSDAAYNNAMFKALEETGNMDLLRHAMYETATGQAYHDNALANAFLEKGAMVWDPKTFKFRVEDSANNWRDMMGDLSKVGEKYGLNHEEINAAASQAFIAERLEGLSKADKEIYSHMTPEQIAKGKQIFKEMPELRKIQEKWNGIRKNAMDVAVEAGLYSKEQAKELLNYMDYVPFYRAEQIANAAGPKEYARSLSDFAKNFKIKGSEQAVNNIFDNMERWTSYTVSRAVRNQKANSMYSWMKKVIPDEVKDLRTDERVKHEQNVVEIWRDGQRARFEVKDPLFVHAFNGVESVGLPMMGWWQKATNLLRQNIVLNPFFSLSQLPQDAIAAMLSSGVKSPFKLGIEVVKEFTKTLFGRSAAGEELYRYGATGDFSGLLAKNEVAMVHGFKEPSLKQKLLAPFEKIAMASDNAVRQAIYNRTMAETNGDKAKAIERAFEIINFKRQGASGVAQILRQNVPFFGAYLQAQNVAYKVLAGRGIAPATRNEVYKTLINNSMKLAALGFIYSSLVSNTKEYQEMDPAIRDRHLLIPGTPFMLPLRSDVFLLPKLAAEYTYNYLTDTGYSDGRKMRNGMADSLTNMILSPTAVPQAVKPALEVMTNYDFFSGRPIVGTGLKERPTELQYSTNTSELAKAIGASGLISPMAVDHLIKGYLGTTGGMVLMATNAMAREASGIPTPEKSVQDAFATFPGMSAFVAKEHGSGLKNDFYELHDEVTKAVNGYNTLMKKGQVGEAVKFIQGETSPINPFAVKNTNLYQLKQATSAIDQQLAKLRQYETMVREAPASQMNAKQKGDAIEQIRQLEEGLLQNVSALRKAAGY